MNKSLYYIECTAKDDLEFTTGYLDNRKTSYKKGEVVYYNPNTTSTETYIGYSTGKNPYRIWSSSHLPFTRQKRYAKKWQLKDYVDKYARYINEIGQFEAIVKEIKITYTEEEV